MDDSQENARGNDGGTTTTTVGRLRAASVSTVSKVMEFNPQPGMWTATGTAIARAPNVQDLKTSGAGDQNITFDRHGHGTHKWHRPHLHKKKHNRPSEPIIQEGKSTGEPSSTESDAETPGPTDDKPKATFGATVKAGLIAAGKFIITPTGAFITIYGLNVVAWGAMLFFLLLKAAPAMDHPDNGDANSSPRKIWIEIDSQILNALFCLTSFGLAPWRFRDLWWCIQWRHRLGKDRGRHALFSLAARNASWFRMPPEMYEPSAESEPVNGQSPDFLTMPASGVRAPPTALWKLVLQVWLMVLNSLFQVGMAFMMWRYNRIDRPSWGAGLFIGLGCASSMFAGIISWWEGRKVKKIEGLIVPSKEIDSV
ncbi:hypothetical protein K461DRAFT_280616 [Myriangium duriaei CBS 260.36]|uniref:Uncharacterized protein n=1 Tax=Myriangium duriaei CBS 260.36 TaxID=1168546 RepID=A0A9P4IVC0_9PEZI|nr:hypothetical protein K461DRAFT_280616 [Myriangium duriaei CBS 260.36]